MTQAEIAQALSNIGGASKVARIAVTSVGEVSVSGKDTVAFDDTNLVVTVTRANTGVIESYNYEAVNGLVAKQTTPSPAVPASTQDPAAPVYDIWNSVPKYSN